MGIERKSDIVAVLATDTELVEAASAEDIVLVSLIFGNVDGTSAVTVKVTLTKSGEAALDIVNALSLAAGEAVEFLIGGKGSMFLEPGDVLSATAGAAGDLTATMSWLSVT